MDSPDYSDSDDSNSTDGAPKVVQIRPKVTDLGKRIIFTSGNDKKQKFGVLRYVGEPEFSEGVWCGVELDQPNGKNNGSVHGIRYFMCEDNCGVFVPVSKVELDTNRRSRSRPNSQPSSRAPSVERKESPRPASVKSSAPPVTPSVNKVGLSIQNDLVNRLSQPIKRTTVAQHSNRRQPMKAFATKGVAGKEIQVKEAKKTSYPFRTGGMYKAASTENLRNMKDKDKTKSASHKQSGQNMPTRKSSSERDLRNSGKTSSGSPAVPISSANAKGKGGGTTAKAKRKQVRVNSCSDLIAADPSSSPASCTSSTTASNSHTSLNGYPWPRTSTPGSRDELTPDGCSSPEEAEDSRAKQRQSLSISPANQAFIETPRDQCDKAPPSKTENSCGLSTHARQFVETEISSPSLQYVSVQSPDCDATPKSYKNRPSGTATLPHPLTNSIFNEGKHLLDRLLGPNRSVS